MPQGNELDTGFWLAALRRDAALLRAAVTPDVFDTQVPSCPEWTVRDLVHHVGTVYGVARVNAAGGNPAVPARPTGDLPDDAGLLAWWDGEFQAMHDVLEKLDPEQPAWNWAPRAKVVAFWPRRMAHETAVHRWDAQMAAGVTEPLDVEIAADGITEVLDTWLPGGKGKGDGAAEGVVRLIATDAEREWHIRVGDGTVALLDTATLVPEDPAAHAQAVGTASDLELALYGRLGFDALELAGDPRLLDQLRVG